MPFKSDKQRRLFYAAKNDPKIAKRVGVPQSVAREFIAKDKKKRKKK